ncbi:MAG: type II toxin-antitoxin system prevent-host-death family antitoxin [Deltaproteobacteria bacterium]|nr:type II toxin-antitoxin system prevent-host-death family antitoxin [Deltaproteobacteria bacterium]
MKSVKTSELKANLAKYLRLVRSGEMIEVWDRGHPIAVIGGIEKNHGFTTIPPLKNPADISKLKSEVAKAPKTDVVRLLLGHRRR